MIRNPVRWEHVEAFRAGRKEEIPADILPHVIEQEKARGLLKDPVAPKPAYQPKKVDAEEEKL